MPSLYRAYAIFAIAIVAQSMCAGYLGQMTVKDDTRATRERSFGWMIQRIAKSMDDKVTVELETVGLTLPEFPVMMLALEHGALTQADIARSYDRPAYVISRALDGLEKKGLIERRAHPTSRRAHQVFATEAGEELAPQLHAIVRSVNQDALGNLSEFDRENLVRILRELLP